MASGGCDELEFEFLDYGREIVPQSKVKDSIVNKATDKLIVIIPYRGTALARFVRYSLFLSVFR